MKDFSRLTSHVAPIFPDKKRKEQFVDRLKGNQWVKVLPSIPVGATFSIVNTATSEIHQVVKENGENWMMWGTGGMTLSMTNADLEEYITEQAKIALKVEKDLRIMDENGCLEWKY